jgi:hypothetical protein
LFSLLAFTWERILSQPMPAFKSKGLGEIKEGQQKFKSTILQLQLSPPSPATDQKKKKNS